MPAFSGKIELLEYDKRAHIEAIHKKLELHMRIAARAFIRAAIADDGIPVVTGMAKGSFLNIGRALRVAIPIHPVKRTRERKTKIYVVEDEWYYPPTGGKIRKDPEAGASLSTTKDEMFVKTDKGLAFFFDSRVFHYTLEDQIGVRSPTAPWKTLQKGREAFILSMADFKDRAPSVKKYIIKTTITFGKNGYHIKRGERLRERKQRTVKGE